MKISLCVMFLLGITLCSSHHSFAQNTVPEGISYQAVARDLEGAALADQELAVRLGIIRDIPDGTLVYEEEHLVFTNQFGLFNLNIGEGIATGNGTVDAFDEINWGSASHFLKVELEDDLGEWQWFGTTQMMAVPYALYAKEVADKDDADANPSNELITDFETTDNEITITEQGTVHTIDLTPMLTDALAGESLTLVQFDSPLLNIVEGDDAFVVDLTELLTDDDWEMTDDVIYHTATPVGVGITVPTSGLHVNTSLAKKVNQFQGPVVINLDATHHVVLANCTNGDVTINLPSATSCPGRSYVIKQFGVPFEAPIVGDVDIIPQDGETIEGDTVYSLETFNSETAEIISDGSNWYVIALN